MKTTESQMRLCPVCRIMVNKANFEDHLLTVHVKPVLDANTRAEAYITKRANAGDVEACNIQRKMFRAKERVKELS